MDPIWNEAAPQLRDLAVYQPGKPIEETARELGVDPDVIVKLASNENPLGPSPAAIAAIRAALERMQLYPDGGGFYLREALAQHLGFSREHIILGAGSNEIIEFLGHGFLASGDNIVTSQHAFVAYRLVAKLFGAATIEAPSPDYQHHLDTILASITDRTRLIFIANPNNPTGTLLGQAEIDSFMAEVPQRIVTVFDEAYYEFLDHPPDTLRYVREGRNVVVLRTFSKIHGLAGLRIGYGIARPELMAVLQKTRQPFNVTEIGQIGALAALRDQKHQAMTKKVVDEGRVCLEAEFHALNLPFVRGYGNFNMVNVGDGPGVFQKLLAHHVIVRPLKGYDLPQWVRISIGTPEQNRKCVAALREICATTAKA